MEDVMAVESRSSGNRPLTEPRLRTPRSAAVAGIVFAVVTIVFMALIRTAIPAGPPTDPGWLTEDEGQVSGEVTLVPFAAIAFLWFIGVLRDLLGGREDQFFASIFLSGGLLFLGGMFVWVGAVAAALASSNASPVEFAESPAYVLVSSLIKVMGSDVILPMAGVFMFSAAMMWLRTKVMPRWVVIVTFIGALVLLVRRPGSRLLAHRVPGVGLHRQRRDPRRPPAGRGWEPLTVASLSCQPPGSSSHRGSAGQRLRRGSLLAVQPRRRPSARSRRRGTAIVSHASTVIGAHRLVDG
ncbi:MAG: hypothetical protein ACR2N6_07065 [Miltoncostaeaceae bacterium]